MNIFLNYLSHDRESKEELKWIVIDRNSFYLRPRRAPNKSILKRVSVRSL